MELAFRNACAPETATTVLAAALACFAALPAQAQTDTARGVKNPPLLELQRKPPRTLRLSASQATRAPVSHEASLDLNVVYTDGKLWNPAEQRFDKVHLRSYQDTRVDPKAPFVSPMLEIRPGDTIRIRLNNQLPPDPSCTAFSGGVNTPHCFNGTNLHTHGLWVNPAGNGDNVLISINPTVSFEYEYNIPSDHPAGTFWYQTHRHDSTALQVASGMAGALVIRGDRPPTPTQTGDVDTLLRPTARQSFKERVVVLQQIQYACRDQDNRIQFNPDGTYRCNEGDVGTIEHYQAVDKEDKDQFGPGTWPASGRYTSINGQVLPNFEGAKAGQIERWRTIHGGVRDTINLEFRKLRTGARSAQALKASEHDAYIEQNCTGAPLQQHLIAADGLTTAAAIRSTQTIYQPAYRWDTLMVFPEAGDYCVIDGASPPSANVNQAPPSRQLLGVVSKVAPGGPVAQDVSAYLAAELAAAAANLPSDVQGKVIADLKNGLRLSSFVPHATVQDREVTGTQTLAFNIDLTAKPIQFQVDGKPVDPNRIDRVLALGGVDEWTLQSDFVSHPFHIHVNPFQIVKILDPDGKDVSGPDAQDDAGGAVDPQYRGLKGVWKDTLWVKNIATKEKPNGKYTLIVPTRYQRYIGDYVLHCHILDHEDQGMMQIVRVAVPDGAGGASKGHH
ncbi:multicopper oxidase domain-containing protein [Acidovorax sp. SUPP3334]|uniref:multicopper oxidase family protein n=1 Tax=Acidovorax sp. SUPP3334 TaxID=2920881 RepID=UPI0023DE1A1C|nr:multicopper oxidase domain-containing protein [Acidovorax sp. SUPP3334]GKT26990.1 multicopper oxidase domain-containing protein [Acidovorax sp. SUPP3334]